MTRCLLIAGVLMTVGCGSRPAAAGEEATLTGYLYAPLSFLCRSQAADPSLPELGASLDTLLTEQRADDSPARGFDFCDADGPAPITSLKLLQGISDVFRCPMNNPPYGCLLGQLRYSITGTYEQSKVCSTVAKGEPLKCTTSTVFVPTIGRVLYD